MSPWREALLGEFRVSLLRTLAARRPTRLTASRGFTVHHPERISFRTPDARLRLGTHGFGFARGDQGDEDFHEVIVDGEVRPTSGPISIGNHVWIGSRATILKGAVIPDDTAVAAGAVVSGQFTEPGTVLAGCPARMVRKNVVWT
jgi:acetyltransferase-like isoleucine patch superfamily enzyme